MRYVPHRPQGAPLVSVVELMFHLADYQPDHRVERLVPDGRTALIIELDDEPRVIYDNQSGAPRQRCRQAWVSGVQQRYLSFGEVQDTELLAVLMPPGKPLALLHRPLADFNDRVVPASEVFGPIVLELRAKLAALPTSAAKLEVLEHWLSERYDPALASHPVVDAAVQAIASEPTIATVRGLTERIGVSRKHLAQLFRRHVGPTPKTLQRILRFAAALARLEGRESVDWVALSLDCGYCDQSHFIRDFRAFSGYRPGQFVAAGFDRPNFFPEDPPR